MHHHALRAQLGGHPAETADQLLRRLAAHAEVEILVVEPANRAFDDEREPIGERIAPDASEHVRAFILGQHVGPVEVQLEAVGPRWGEAVGELLRGGRGFKQDAG